MPLGVIHNCVYSDEPRIARKDFLFADRRHFEHLALVGIGDVQIAVRVHCRSTSGAGVGERTTNVRGTLVVCELGVAQVHRFDNESGRAFGWQ